MALMPVSDKQERLDWPIDELEYLNECPVCRSENRALLYPELADRLFNTPGSWTIYRCNSCGCGYIDPRPDRRSIKRAYLNYPTHQLEHREIHKLRKSLRVALRNGYLNRKYGLDLEPATAWGLPILHLLPPPLRLEWDHYARHLSAPVKTGSRLLDIGCGNGDFLARARSAGWEVFGIDFDQAAAELCRRRNVDAWVGDYQDAPFDAGSFDAITAEQVLEHVHDPENFLRKCRHWLRTGGTLWIGTPNFNSRLHRRFGPNYKLLHPPQHLTLFTPDSLEALLRKARFKHIHFKPRGFLEHHVIRASAALAYGAQTQEEVTQLEPRAGVTAWWYELMAYLQPSRGSDLVVIARK